MFVLYKDIDGDSNVDCYEIGNDYVAVKFFGTARIYKYTYASAGVDRVERMKVLAKNGDGLNRYINLYVKNGYE